VLSTYLQKRNGKNYGFREKNDLEAWICNKSRLARSTREAHFDRLTADWIKL
jgi:hypothetical protein